ncbi:MAG: hypothetical protein GY754_22835 [bacterium]|nr:hypothetical protein [bacterium]
MIHKTSIFNSLIVLAVLFFSGCDGNIFYDKINESPKSVWPVIYGESNQDQAVSIIQSSDGGYLAVGFTKFYMNGVLNTDYSMVKFNRLGKVEWEKNYGGMASDFAHDVYETSDGGYVIAGRAKDYYGVENYDFHILKINASGETQWQQAFGGSGLDAAESIVQTADGGYIAAGFTNSYGSGLEDGWIIKLDSQGTLEWENLVGGALDDRLYSVRQTPDGGYIAAGAVRSGANGYYDMIVVKYTSTGTESWNKLYGGSGWEKAYSIELTDDGGYVITGYTGSYTNGENDIWVLKLTAAGDVAWSQNYGGIGKELAHAIRQTADGGYIIAAYTNSYGNGDCDHWIVKIDASGNRTWDKTYGGSGNDRPKSIQQTTDGGYIVAGYTGSNSQGESDSWVYKLDANGEMVR